MTNTDTIGIDTVLGFTIASRHARGRMARLGPVLDTILGAHAYPAPLARLLAEALVLAALLGSTLKEADGQLTLQAQTEQGIVDLLVVDYRGGELRGYIRHDRARLADHPVNPSLASLFGKGYLAITFDQAALPGESAGQRYQGIVPLEGASLADAVIHYFAQSEQIPSFVRVAVRQEADGRYVAGGLLVQHLPEGEEGRERLHTRLDHPEWEHVEILATTVAADELTDPALPLDSLLWRLFHEEREVRTLPAASLSRGCRCSPDYIRSVLARFPAEEREGMKGEDGLIRVDCEFCARAFPIPLEDAAAS
ncbi:MAG TPA: Hsp33 family molecular chaperone HslO [Sphingomonas sp.]